MATTDSIEAQMIAEQNACPHFGSAAAQRVRTDTKLAWLKGKQTDKDVSSLYGLIAYWGQLEAYRQQRIKHLILAREAQLRRFPVTFHAELIKSVHVRNRDAIIAAYEAKISADNAAIKADLATIAELHADSAAMWAMEAAE